MILNYRTGTDVTGEAFGYIDARRKGLITSLKTKFTRLDSRLMGGLETNTITTISAISGAGKSTLSKCLRDSIRALNPTMRLKSLIFNFEMISIHQVNRSLSTAAQRHLRDILSVDKPLSDAEFAYLKRYYENLATDDIAYIDVAGTYKDICDTIESYWYTECAPKDGSNGHTLYVEIDHVLLTKGLDGDSEKKKIDDLMVALVNTKKLIASKGGSVIYVVLSQMNRDIKSVERRQNSSLHRPDTGCLMGASSIEFASDYILFAHAPGRLALPYYTDEKYPTWYKTSKDSKAKPMIYFELVKNRSGAPDLTFPMWNNLEYFDFEEMDHEVFKKLHQDAIASEFKNIPIVQTQLTL